MTTLTSTPAITLQQRRPAAPVLPSDDFDCSAGEDCFYCACPETD